MTTERVITIQDARDAGFCVSGIREYCRAHGLDFRKLLRGGLPSRDVEHLDDVSIRRVLAVVEKRGGTDV